MYTKEDIENLAEFMYLAASQEMLYGENSNEFEGGFTEWIDYPEYYKEVYRIQAKIAFDFIKYRE